MTTAPNGMTCLICKHGQTSCGHAVVTLGRGHAVVVFNGVPADVCDNCGEYYLTEAVTRELIDRAEAAIAGGAEVGVLRYAA